MYNLNPRNTGNTVTKPQIKMKYVVATCLALRYLWDRQMSLVLAFYCIK